ncbi:MAG: SRPBCC family protein [Anaerolineae bacterium]|nr:SRPBCC family protein [Anaerolineae bacterium]
MVVVQGSIMIGLPAEAVFAYISNYENDPQWRAGVTRMDQSPKGAAQLGTVTREVLKAMGRANETLAKVVEYEPNRKIAFKSFRAEVPVDGWRAVESVEGGTHFTYYLHMDLSGMYGLMSPIILWMFQTRLEGDLKTLKSVLEAKGEATV